MAISAAHLVIATAVSLFLLWVFWQWFWRRHVTPPSRTSAAWGGFVLALFASFPAVWVAEGLVTGHMPCVGRGCGDITYSVATSPLAFWIAAAVLATLGSFFLSGALFAAFKALAPRRVAP